MYVVEGGVDVVLLPYAFDVTPCFTSSSSAIPPLFRVHFAVEVAVGHPEHRRSRAA